MGFDFLGGLDGPHARSRGKVKEGEAGGGEDHARPGDHLESIVGSSGEVMA